MGTRLISTALALLFTGCTPQEKPAPAEAVSQEADSEKVAIQMAQPPSVQQAADRVRRSTWSQVLDTCVVVRGHVAGGMKTDPRLRMGSNHPAGDIDVELVEGSEPWGTLEPSTLVEVRGTVVDKHDLRVVVLPPEELRREGTPMPTEAEIDLARTHYVLADATVRVLRAIEEVEADLGDRVGELVDLPGVLWSLNGHWWFNHDGLDVHLDALHKIAGWGEPDGRWPLHGQAMVVRGRLDRRPMPRIDQIPLKSDRDLADAFVVQVDETKPYPIRPIEPCP